VDRNKLIAASDDSSLSFECSFLSFECSFISEGHESFFLDGSSVFFFGVGHGVLGFVG